MTIRILSRPLLCSIAILLALSHAPICTADDPDRPPPLTFDKHVDYLKWYDQFVSKGRKESDNANALYKKLEPDSEGKGGLQLPKDSIQDQFEAMRRPWTKEEFPQLKSYLDRVEPLLVRFKQATKRPYFWQTRNQKEKTLIDVVFPSLAPCRAGCRTLILQGWLKGDDQTERMFANWRVILANAKHFAEQPVLIGQLVSIADRSLVYQQAHRAVRAGIIKGEDFSQALATIGKNDPRKPRLPEMAVLEWALVLNALQLVAPDGRIDKREWDEFGKKIAAQHDMNSSSFDPKLTRDAVDDFFQRFLVITRKPMSLEGVKRIRKLCRSYGPDHQENAFLAIFVPGGYARAYELMLRTEVQRRGTMLVLALHDHKYKTKNWPAKLDDLQIDDLKTLRIDPYSDKDFIYKLTPDGPLLYSIASDGKDDGGRHDPKWGESPNGGDYVIWPVQDDSPPTTQPQRGE